MQADASGSELYGKYILLYMAAATAVRRYIKRNSDELQFHDTSEGSLPISYNLGMTRDAMVSSREKVHIGGRKT